MGRYRRLPIPEGFSIVEFPDGRFAGQRDKPYVPVKLQPPLKISAPYKKRLGAVMWCMKEAARENQRRQAREAAREKGGQGL